MMVLAPVLAFSMSRFGAAHALRLHPREVVIGFMFCERRCSHKDAKCDQGHGYLTTHRSLHALEGDHDRKAIYRKSDNLNAVHRLFLCLLHKIESETSSRHCAQVLASLIGSFRRLLNEISLRREAVKWHHSRTTFAENR